MGLGQGREAPPVTLPCLGHLDVDSLSIGCHTGLGTLGQVPRQREPDRGEESQAVDLSGALSPRRAQNFLETLYFPRQPPPPHHGATPEAQIPRGLALHTSAPRPPARLPSPALRQPHLDPLSALSHVKGLHLNMTFVLNPGTLTLLLGRCFPRFFGYTQRDIELLYPFKEKVFYSLMRESGYMHIQGTKPDTVGECVLRMLRPSLLRRGPHPSHSAGRLARGPYPPRNTAPG